MVMVVKRKQPAPPGPVLPPEGKEQGTDKPEVVRTNIDLGRGYTLTADPYSWCLTRNGKSLYFPTLSQVLNHAYNTELRTANCRSLDRLYAVAKETQGWIRDMLSPLDSWKELGVQLGPELGNGIGELVRSVSERGQSKKGRRKAQEETHGDTD